MLNFNYYNVIFILSIVSIHKVQSDLEIPEHNIEYGNLRIDQQQSTLKSLSPSQFKYETKEKSWIKPLQNVKENDEKSKKANKKVEATLATTLCNQPLADAKKQNENVKEKLIIENGVNQPHNHENQQNLTVNQVKEKQQLSQHHFKLLNVVKPRNKRQFPAVNSNGNSKYNNYNTNNNGNQQQFTTYNIQYYPTNQLQQQQEQFQLPQQQQQQQQYQLQYYQQQPSQITTPTQTQHKFQQNFNNIEVIANGNSLSTIPQKTSATLTQSLPIVNMRQQQQSQSIPILITLSTTTTTSKPAIDKPTIKSTNSFTSPIENSFKPFLPLEIIKDYNEGPTTPPTPIVCKICCTPNEQPCSNCCDGNPLLNAQTLKTLGG